MSAPAYTPAGYWNRRYRDGRTSGAGSEGAEGAYKAAYVSEFITKNNVVTVVDWGCGDGQVLELIKFPKGTSYTGVDVSQTIVDRMRAKFPMHKFLGPDDDHSYEDAYRMSISMDVLFHLPDDRDYFEYLDHLFNSAVRHVVIYATDTPDGRTARHVFRRKFTADIAERFLDWELKTAEPPLREGLASFFVYGKVGL
jgi:trans-aconitate methyltransferase